MRVIASFLTILAALILLGAVMPEHPRAPEERAQLIPLDATPVQHTLPMAQTADDCGKPEFDSNNTICHPVGRPVEEPHTYTPVPVAVQRINEALAELGHLTVRRLNYDGFPVFDLECNRHGQCVNGTGHPAGTLKELSEEMEVITEVEAGHYGYRCHIVCYDGQNNIVGAAETVP